MDIPTLIVLIIIVALVTIIAKPSKCVYYEDNYMMCENHGDCEHCAYYRWIRNGKD